MACRTSLIVGLLITLLSGCTSSLAPLRGDDALVLANQCSEKKLQVPTGDGELILVPRRQVHVRSSTQGKWKRLCDMEREHLVMEYYELRRHDAVGTVVLGVSLATGLVLFVAVGTIAGVRGLDINLVGN